MLELTVALVLFLFPLAYSPGPGNMFFAAIGGRFGARASIPASAGYHLATFVVTVAVGVGFAAIARVSAEVFEIMRYLGAAYVFWLAATFLRAGATADDRTARRATMLDGAILLLLNPKAYLIIALMFTQFLPVDSTSRVGLVVWITTVFTLNNLVAFTVWTIAGDVLTRRFRNERSARPLNVASGLMLAAVALWILLR
ncbi:MAG: LysE family translocator [Gemmobacter sp.]